MVQLLTLAPILWVCMALSNVSTHLLCWIPIISIGLFPLSSSTSLPLSSCTSTSFSFSSLTLSSCVLRLISKTLWSSFSFLFSSRTALYLLRTYNHIICTYSRLYVAHVTYPIDVWLSMKTLGLWTFNTA